MRVILTVFTFLCGVLAHAAHLAPWNPDGDGERAGTVESAFGAFTAETGVGIAAGVAGGLVPVYGQMADARDTAANIKNVWDNPGSGEAWAGLAMSGAAWIPGAGDAAKVAYRVGSNVTEEIGNASIRRLSKWEIISSWISRSLVIISSILVSLHLPDASSTRRFVTPAHALTTTTRDFLLPMTTL